MNEISFAGGIRFRGSPEDLGKVIDALTKLHVIIDRELPPGRTQGVMPPALDTVLPVEILRRHVANIKSFKFPGGIWGGIRNAHVHIGEDVFLMDLDRFESVAREAAGELMSRAVHERGFAGAASLLQELSGGPPLPPAAPPSPDKK